MKRIIKSICCLLLLFAMSFSIVGCSNNDDTNKDSNNNTTTNESDEDNGLEGIDSRVKNKFSSDYKVNRDDVNEAVNYILDNIDDVKDKESAITTLPGGNGPMSITMLMKNKIEAFYHRNGD